MSRSFSVKPASAEVYFRLKLLIGGLLLANLTTLVFYLAPPGGTRRALTEERLRSQKQLADARTRLGHLKAVSTQVRTGNGQAIAFQSQFFLPRRQAYTAMVAELQRLAAVSSIHQRDSVFSEEPIEGTADLSLLNSTANFEGNYENLLRFLRMVDQSPMLLMLDHLQASPQQEKGSQIHASIRVQAVIREDGSERIGAKPAVIAIPKTQKADS